MGTETPKKAAVERKARRPVDGKRVMFVLPDPVFGKIKALADGQYESACSYIRRMVIAEASKPA